ncbi:hypothetical protein HDU87_000464 [Geranomyces variabilis]|uniref:Uncharacterized protein n=1 Tax=Geranomyces variabilis TaxID=109894 RepID=A0AAD5TC51_9FUNG|nr:hypothetical protein HDU87_000464 [Geranomyces variabilis]
MPSMSTIHTRCRLSVTATSAAGADEPLSSLIRRFPTWTERPSNQGALCSKVAALRVLARFLADPFPITAYESQNHIRPLQVICLNVPWKMDGSSDPAPDHFDPMLIDPIAPTYDDESPQLTTTRYIDFNIRDHAGTVNCLRMAFNHGDGDSNTGWYATVRDRTTRELIGIATTTWANDSSTLVTCLDDALMRRFVPHPEFPPVEQLIPPFDIGRYPLGLMWNPDSKDELGRDVDSNVDANPALDPFRRQLQSTGSNWTSHGHQVEMLFAMVQNISPDSFETRFDTPEAVALEFAEELLVAAMGTDLLPRELLRMVAGWCPRPTISWSYFS